MSTLIAVPMKGAARAKTRLAGLGDAARARLAHLLLVRVLKAARAVPGARVAVVTACDAVARIARAEGAAVVREPAEAGLDAAAARAARWARARGHARLCVLPGDLAAPDPREVARLIGAAGPGRAVICPSLDLGTNALVRPVPSAMAFRYGPRSAPAHLAAAEAAGLEGVLMPLPSLRLDVDTEDALGRALAAAPELGRALEAGA